MLNNYCFYILISVELLLIGIPPTIAQPTVNPPVRTQTAVPRANSTQVTISFKPPPDNPNPPRTAGAGSRGGGCPQDDTVPSAVKRSLTAIVPTTNTGLTVAERPSFWVYLPKTSARQVVLSIREDGNQHYSQTVLPITGSAGIVGLKPSRDSFSLEVGKTYQWAVVLVCGERPNPNDPAIAAWVRRIAPSQPTNQGTALAQAAWYGEQGIWYDAIAALVKARQTDSNNQALTEIWTGFLNSAGLEAISTEPLQF